MGGSVCHVEMFLESHTHSIHETGIFTYYLTIKINKIHYILLEAILHHLGCKNSHKKHGINYQTQLVSFPDFWLPSTSYIDKYTWQPFDPSPRICCSPHPPPRILGWLGTFLCMLSYRAWGHLGGVRGFGVSQLTWQFGGIKNRSNFHDPWLSRAKGILQPFLGEYTPWN